MNKKLLSILIANAVVTSSTAFADDDTDNFQRLLAAQDKEQQNELTFDSFFSASGTVGTAFEFEDKTTDYKGGRKDKETIKTAYIGKLYYYHQMFNMAFTYDLKTQDLVKRAFDANGSQTGSETSSTWVHVFTAQKAVSLGHGFTTGAFYGIDYQVGVVNGNGALDVDKTVTEHTFHIPLTYYNPKYGMGFYSHVELLKSTTDQEAGGTWGKYEQDDLAYSYLFKPYYRTGNWELGVELFYQKKDTETTWGDSEFSEWYYEPLVTYSFEDAGTLFLRARFGENETINKDNDAEYYTDILKGTVGYEQEVGDDWLVKAEYEYTKDENTDNGHFAWDEDKETIGHKVYLQALYRF